MRQIMARGTRRATTRRSEWLGSGSSARPVHSPRHRDKPPSVTKAGENAGMDTQLQRMRSPKHAPMAEESGFGSAFQVNALHMNGYVCMHLQVNAYVFIHQQAYAGQHPWSTCTPHLHPSIPYLPCMAPSRSIGQPPPAPRDHKPPLHWNDLFDQPVLLFLDLSFTLILA
jgi:hypothetical protein